MIPSTSHVPMDTSEPVLETTVGGVLREAAELDPDGVGLHGDHARGKDGAGRRAEEQEPVPFRVNERFDAEAIPGEP